MITGWFIELTSFTLILSVGIAIGQEIAAQYWNKAVLNERVAGMERLLPLQQTHHAVLQREVKEGHTLRHAAPVPHN